MLAFLITLLVAAPLLHLLVSLLPDDATGWDARHDLLVNGTLQSTWLHTMTVAVLACTIASLVAIPAAFAAVRSDPVIRGLIVILGVLPLTMPAFVTAGLLRDLLGNGDNGVEAGNALLVLVYALHYLPLILLSLIGGLNRIDRSLTESAANLGAGGLTVWRRITLPLATSPFVFGAGLMLLKIIEDIGTPLVLGVDQMLAPQILSLLGDAGVSDPRLASKVLLLLLSTMLITALAWPALIPDNRQTEPANPERWRRRPLPFMLAFLLTVTIAVLALTPYAWLFDGIRASGAISSLDPPQMVGPNDSLGITFAIALGGGLFLTLLAGLSTAPIRTTSWSGNLARFSSTAIFAIPSLVLALAYLHTLSWLGGMPALAWLALALLVAIKHLPVVPHLLTASGTIPVTEQLSLARSFDLPWTSRLSHLLLPAYASVIAGLILLGAGATLMELSAALVLIGHEPAPLAVAVFREIQTPGGQTAASTLTLWLVIGITLCLAAALALLSRRTRYESRQPKTSSPMPRPENTL